MDINEINNFSGDFAWLSNFFPVSVTYQNLKFNSVENAYQAAKCKNPADMEQFISIVPGKAKRLGRTVEVREDWEDIKVYVMKDLLIQKFSNGSTLAELLLMTDSANLVEGNWWGDTFWGVCKGTGQNILGQLLMLQRDNLRNDNIH